MLEQPETASDTPVPKLSLTVVEEHDCPYLPGRKARFLVGPATGITPAEYAQLMDQNFRRSGAVVYQPQCNGCQECRQLRVLVNEFEASKSDRRVLRQNADLVVSTALPKWTQEKADLYSDYLHRWHGTQDRTPAQAGEDLRAFLYVSGMSTVEMEYRLPSGKLVGVGIVDVTPVGLSTVYFYFDASESKRSLGHFSMLREIDLARQIGLKYHYLGYFVANCRKMAYKRRYKPCELLLVGSLGALGEGEQAKSSLNRVMPTSHSIHVAYDPSGSSKWESEVASKA